MREPIVPSALAGTDPNWRPRRPDLSFDVFDGRLCERVEKFPAMRTGRPRKSFDAALADVRATIAARVQTDE